jgi:hypothetical protein
MGGYVGSAPACYGSSLFSNPDIWSPPKKRILKNYEGTGTDSVQYYKDDIRYKIFTSYPGGVDLAWAGSRRAKRTPKKWKNEFHYVLF